MSRILIIDDDRSVRHLIGKAFEGSDVEVRLGRVGRRGTAAIVATSAPDAVLLDIMLPETSGLDLFDQIRAADAKLPIIFITSLDSSETAIKAMTLGAFDYLLKPLDVARIRELVRQALEIRRLMSTPVEVPGDGTGRQQRSMPLRPAIAWSAAARRCRKSTKRSAASRRRTSPC